MNLKFVIVTFCLMICGNAEVEKEQSLSQQDNMNVINELKILLENNGSTDSLLDFVHYYNGINPPLEEIQQVSVADSNSEDWNDTEVNQSSLVDNQTIITEPDLLPPTNHTDNPEIVKAVLCKEIAKQVSTTQTTILITKILLKFISHHCLNVPCLILT